MGLSDPGEYWRLWMRFIIIKKAGVVPAFISLSGFELADVAENY